MVLQCRKFIAAGSALPIIPALSVSSLLEVADYTKNTTAQALKMSVIFAEGCASKSVMFFAKSTDVYGTACELPSKGFYLELKICTAAFSVKEK